MWWGLGPVCGAYVMCVWDYVIRVSEAALVYMFCDALVIRGAHVWGAARFG